MMASKSKTIRHPAAPPEWQESFRSSSMKVGFVLTLSKTMLEMLCAIADDVQWDRALYWGNLHWPDNWIAPQQSLVKRGLIVRKDQKTIDAYKHDNITFAECCERAFWQLTPAGRSVVELVKLAGMFVEADAAINKKSRTA